MPRGDDPGTPTRTSPRLHPVTPAKVASFSTSNTVEEATSALIALGGLEKLAAGVGLGPLGGGAPLGLSQSSVEENRRMFGRNELPKRVPKTFFEHLTEALEDDTIRILVFSAVVSMVFGVFLSPPESRRADIIQAFAIVLAVVVVSGVNSFQNFQKDKEFQSLSELKSGTRQVSVYRQWGGAGAAATTRAVPTSDLVVGDVVWLASGDLIPCDGLVLDCKEMHVDESGETGESVPREKVPCPRGGGGGGGGGGAATAAAKPSGDFVLQGNTKVVEGEGTMLVTGVGTSTKLYKSIELLENAEVEDTPLQERLDEMAKQIGNIGMAAGGLTFLVLLALRLYNPTTGNPLLMDVLQFFIIGVAIVVVAVPEGLPLAVTIALAFSMQAMMKDNCFVRTMKSCETMGSATFICSDKTGTLTENKMTVVKAIVGGTPGAIGPLNGLSKEALVAKLGTREYITHVRRAIALNREAVTRSPLEAALLAFADAFSDRAEAPEVLLQNFTVLARVPFRKDAKFQMTVVRENAPGGTAYAFLLGAPEVVVPRTTEELTSQGSHVPWKKDGPSYGRKARPEEEMRVLTRQGLRVVSLAFKHVEGALDEASALEAGAKNDYVHLGLFAVSDPLRAEVKKAISDCKSAGITVIMLTGDNKDTAEHIAEEAGILSSSPRLSDALERVVEGSVLRRELESTDGEMVTLNVSKDEEKGEGGRGGGGGGGGSSDSSPSPKSLPVASSSKGIRVNKAALEKLPHLRVVARCVPRDKFMVVAGLQHLNQVVAVTGDGTNDAPALKKADVGLAMGITGTDVAKEASDIVILNDSFESIVKAVRWGRSIKENIRKFLSFQLTINIVALTLTFVSACTSGGRSELPLKPVQLLWVNLIMDSFAALALATEPPHDKLMLQKPQGRDAALITPTMWVNMVGHALLQIAVLLVLTQMPASAALFEMKPSDLGNSLHDTIIFTTFVAMQWFNLFNCRSVDEEWSPFADFQSSKFAMAIQFVIAVCQVVIVQLGGSIMQTVPLTGWQWAACVAIGSLSLVWGVFVKAFSACVAAPREGAKTSKRKSE